MRLFNEFTAGSDLLRIWPRTTTPNSIAAFSMIHLLYDRVDRDSALITRPSHPARGQLSVADSDARRREKGGIKTKGRGKIRGGIFRGAARRRRTVSVLFLSEGDGAVIAFYGDRFDLDLLSLPPPSIPRDWWVISDSDNGIRSFVRSFGRSTDPVRRVRETRLIVYTMQIEYPLNDSLDPIDLEIGYKR